jgi:hypothetical protein
VIFAGVDWLLYAVITPGVFRLSRRAGHVCGVGDARPFSADGDFPSCRLVPEHTLRWSRSNMHWPSWQARERETQAVRLTAQLAEARLRALRTQLNPRITVLVRDALDHRGIQPAPK